MKPTIDTTGFKHKAIKSFEAPASALAKWQPEIHAKDDETAINIYSTIGDYGDGQGMTAKVVSGILRKASGDISVNINSPGGDFFEGVAIYNLLKEYDGKINIKIVGLAASAASIVAMAADTLEIAESGFLMIHNAWTLAIGNKEDMHEVADMLAKFDESMAAVYSASTGIDEKEIKKMMKAETWLSGKEAIDLGFADTLMGGDEVKIDDSENPQVNSALKKIDVALARDGVSRSERRDIIKKITSTPGAAEATPRASELVSALSGLLHTLQKG